MADEIVVKSAQVSLSPAPSAAGASIIMTTHTLSTALSGPFTTSESNEVLVQSDIDASFLGFSTPYTKASYVGGTLMYQSLKSVSNLSQLIKKDGKPVVIKKTTGTITCAPAPPANDPNIGPDATPMYDIDFSFTNAGQTVSKVDA